MEDIGVCCILLAILSSYYVQNFMSSNEDTLYEFLE